MVELCYKDLLHGVNLKYTKLDLLMDEINSDFSERMGTLTLTESYTRGYVEGLRYTKRYVKELIEILKPLANPIMLISLAKTYENYTLNIHFLREKAKDLVYGHVNEKIPVTIDIYLTKAFMANVAYPDTLTIK